MTTDRPTGRALLLAAALAVCLVAGSRPRIVGDGGEYLAQAINFSHLRGPALRPADIPDIQARIAAFEPVLADWQIDDATVAGPDRRRDFLHFWFYALLATPALWVVTAVGAAPTYAFAILNLVLLGVALRVALPRIGAAACVLLFASPIIWWIDKAHTEVFTFSLLVIAFALMRERPWWAMVAGGAAATQNPPIGIVFGLVFLWVAARGRTFWRDRRVLAGVAAGGILALLHPVYTYARFGTPSLLLRARRPGVPTLAEIRALVTDPTIGLIGSFPIFLAVVLAAIVLIARRDSRRGVRPEAAIVILSGAAFLLSCAQTTNLHHGATPSLSRYALWLIPLAVPPLAWLYRHGSSMWQRGLLGTAIASALISVFAFHPSVPQYGREPTWLGAYLWTHHPAWDNPLPEVFIETELHEEAFWAPVATPGCEKVLIAGRGTDEGLWPVPCYPAPIPDRCLEAGAICYANRHGTRYDFVAAPGRWLLPPRLRREWTWPKAAEARVRQQYDAWRWAELSFDPDVVAVLRQTVGADVSVVGRPERFILTFQNIEPGALVRIRPVAPMSGTFVDPESGAIVQPVHLDGPTEDLQTVSVPGDHRLLLLAMRTDDAS
jgi:hypothetical protein